MLYETCVFMNLFGAGLATGILYKFISAIMYYLLKVTCASFVHVQLSQVQLERQSCPHCSKELTTPTEEREGAMIGSSEEVQPLDVASSKAILSQLHAIQTAATRGNSPSPIINGRELNGSDSSLSVTLINDGGD